MEQTQTMTTAKDIPIVMNHKWEEGNIDPVDLPDVTYGECTRAKCTTVGELGNGVCVTCWDKGSDMKKKRRKKNKDVPIIVIG